LPEQKIFHLKSFRQPPPVFSVVLRTSADVGDSAANGRALIEIDDRADAVITIGDNEGEPVSHVPANKKNGRERLAFLNPLQVLIDMRLVTRQKRELSRAQQVLRGVLNRLCPMKALDERVGFRVGTQKRKIFERGLEILVFLLFAPLEIWLAHPSPLLSFETLPGMQLTADRISVESGA
jgi:hypothetical protein